MMSAPRDPSLIAPVLPAPLSGSLESPRFLPYIAAFNTAILWSTSPVFMRFVSASYDPFTQAFVRYFSGLVLLVPVSLYFFPVEFKRLLRNPGGLWALGVLSIIHLTLWTHAIYYTTATTGMLITKLQVPLIIIFSFMLFREERGVIRSPNFLIGAMLGLCGVLLIALAKSPAAENPKHYLAVIMLLFVALNWAVYTVWSKHLVRNVHPIPMFTTVALITATGFLILMLTFGRPATLVEAGPRIALIAFASGVLPIGVAHGTYLYAQKHIGSAVTANITLLSPLFTHLIAWQLWPDEKLVAIQWFGAGALLFGSFLVIQAQRTRGQPRAAKAVPAPPE